MYRGLGTYIKDTALDVGFKVEGPMPLTKEQQHRPETYELDEMRRRSGTSTGHRADPWGEDLNDAYCGSFV
jgi:hypothetical protein